MKKTTLLLAVSIIACTSNFSVEGADEHPYVQRIASIRAPDIDIKQGTVQEIFEYLRLKSRDWDPEPEPAMKGFTLITLSLALDDIKEYSYKVSNVSMGQVFQDLAMLMQIDFHITNIGVVATAPNQPPFPNAKASGGAVFKTYRAAGERVEKGG